MKKREFESFLSDSLFETLEVDGPEAWSRFVRDLFFGWFESSNNKCLDGEERASIVWHVQRLVEMFDKIHDEDRFADQLPVRP